MFGLGVITLLSPIILFAFFRLVTTPMSLETFWLAMIFLVASTAATLFGYWTFAASRMAYEFDRLTLTIRWGLMRQIIPLSTITGVTSGSEVNLPRRFAGLQWPGYTVGRANIDEIGNVAFFSTHRRADEVLVVHTSTSNFGISPMDTAGFLTVLERAVGIEPDTYVLPRVEYAGPLRLGIWRDGFAMSLAGICFLLNAALFAYVLHYYPELPALLPLHFNVLGEVDFIGPRQDVLRLPLIPLALFSTNFVLATILHIRERLASHLTLGVALLVEVMFWVATTRIVY